MRILSGRQQMELNQTYHAEFKTITGVSLGTLTMKGAREVKVGNVTIPTMTGKQRIRRLILKCPSAIPTDTKGIHINKMDVAMHDIKRYA